MKYGDGVQIRGNRDLEECFAQANDQMDILDGLIREMRQMGQPCEMYQKRYCQGRAGEGNVADRSLWCLKCTPSLVLQDVTEVSRVCLGHANMEKGPAVTYFLHNFTPCLSP